MGMAALLIAAVALAPVPSPAPHDIHADLRCVIVSAVAASSKDPAMARAGQTATLYWFGRIDRGYGDAQLRQMLAAEARQMPATARASEYRRCNAELAVRGQAMQSIGESLEAQAPH